MLKPKLGENEARMFIQHFEESFEEQFTAKSLQLASKADIYELRGEMKQEIAELRLVRRSGRTPREAYMRGCM